MFRSVSNTGGDSVHKNMPKALGQGAHRCLHRGAARPVPQGAVRQGPTLRHHRRRANGHLQRWRQIPCGRGRGLGGGRPQGPGLRQALRFAGLARRNRFHRDSPGFPAPNGCQASGAASIRRRSWGFEILATPPARGMSSRKRRSRGRLKSASAARQRSSMAELSCDVRCASAGTTKATGTSPPHRIGFPDDRDLAHPLDLTDRALDLRRANVLAADLEHVLGAVGEAEQPVLVHRHQIAGDEIAALVERSGGRFRIVKILPEQGQARSSADAQLAGLARPGRAAVLAQDREPVFRRRTADGAVALGQAGIADDAVGDDLGHAPPAEQRHAEMFLDRRIEDGMAPVAEPVPFRHGLAPQRFRAKRHQRGPCAAVPDRRGPEPTSRETRLQHDFRARPQARHDRVNTGYDVKQRQGDEMAVGLGQAFVIGRDLAAPQHVVVGPDDSLGLGRAARGVVDRDRSAAVSGRGGRLGRVTEQRLEPVVARRPIRVARLRAGVATGHRDPVQPGAGLAHQRRKGGLGDRGPHRGMFGEPGQFLAACPGIGGHGHRAGPRQGVPCQEIFRRVLQVNHHTVARSDAAADQPVREPGNVVGEAGIGPGFRCALEVAPRSGTSACRGSPPVAAAGGRDRGRHRG